MSTIEIVAALFGFVCGYLTIIQNIWCWPTGIVQVILYIFVFYSARLYSDMILQIIFIFVQGYGWYFWVYGPKVEDRVPVVPLSRSRSLLWGAVAIAGSGGLGFLMKTHTNADFAYLDATTTVLSLIAQYLQGIKILQSWLIWIVVDVLAIGIYYAKGLYPTLILYIVYLGMATAGYFTWKKKCLPTPPASS
jgi:nicotinamide mononucleotide transporter